MQYAVSRLHPAGQKVGKHSRVAVQCGRVGGHPIHGEKSGRRALLQRRHPQAGQNTANSEDRLHLPLLEHTYSDSHHLSVALAAHPVCSTGLVRTTLDGETRLGHLDSVPHRHCSQLHHRD